MIAYIETVISLTAISIRKQIINMNNIKSLAVLLWLFIGLTTAFAQPTFNIGSASGDQGNIVSVDITVDDFADLIGMAFRMNWDPSVAEYEGMENVNTAFNGLAFATPPALAEGELRANWFDFNNPVTLANGALLMSVKFKLVGTAGSSTDLTFDLDPNRLEAVHKDDPTVNIGANVQSGSLMILGVGGQGFNLIIDDRTVEPGMDFCISVRVQDFEDVKALEFNVNWDESVLTYTGIQGFNLPGLDPADFNDTNADMGVLRLAWVSANPDGETLSDNATLFEICFTASGSSGSSTDVTFSDLVTVPANPGIINGTINIQGSD